MTQATLTRVITGYNPVLNGYGCGFGTVPWGAIITSTLQAGVAISTLVYQDKLRRDAETSARHEAARERAHQLELQRLAAARAKEAAEAAAVGQQIAAGATGGAVAVDATGRLIPPSGILSSIVPRGAGGMWLIGGLGLAAIVVIGFMGRRR